MGEIAQLREEAKRRDEEAKRLNEDVRKLQKKVESLEDENKTLRSSGFLEKLHSPSKTDVFAFAEHTFTSVGTAITRLGLRRVTPRELKDCWVACKDIILMNGGQNEIRDVHSFMRQVIEAIIKTLSLRIRYHSHAHWGKNIPDAVVTSRSIRFPSVLSCRAAFEYKRLDDSLHKEGQGQAISYLTELVSNVESTAEFSQYYSMFSDGKGIALFRFEWNEQDGLQGSYFPLRGLFEAPGLGRDAEDDITAGFEALVCLLVTLDYDESPEYLVSNGITYSVTSCLSRGEVSVYEVETTDGSRFVAKKVNAAKFKHQTANALSYEYHTIKALTGVNKAEQLSYDKNNDCLIMKAYEPLVSSLGELRLNRSKDSEFAIFKLARECFMQLDLLHHAGKVHLDTRVENFVVDEGKVIIIDWMTAITDTADYIPWKYATNTPTDFQHENCPAARKRRADCEIFLMSLADFISVRSVFKVDRTDRLTAIYEAAERDDSNILHVIAQAYESLFQLDVPNPYSAGEMVKFFQDTLK